MTYHYQGMTESAGVFLKAKCHHANIICSFANMDLKSEQKNVHLYRDTGMHDSVHMCYYCLGKRRHSHITLCNSQVR